MPPSLLRSATAAPLLLAALGCAGLADLDLTPSDEARHLTAAEAQARGHRVPDGARDVSARTAGLADATVAWQRFELGSADLDGFLADLPDHVQGVWPADRRSDWPELQAIDPERFGPPAWWVPLPGSAMRHRTQRASQGPGGSQGSGDLVVVSGLTVYRQAWTLEGWGLLPAFDLSTDEGVLAAWNAASGSRCDQLRNCLCVRRLRASDRIVLVGTFAFDAGCRKPGVFVGQEWHRSVGEGSSAALAELGWASASPERRAELALAWSREGLRAFSPPLLDRPDGRMPPGEAFEAPSAAADDQGGVRVSGWVRPETEGRRPRPAEEPVLGRWSARFASSGDLAP